MFMVLKVFEPLKFCCIYLTTSFFQDLHILDAGCGTGQYAKSLAELGVGKISLLDASKEMLDIAKGKLRDYIETKVIDKVIKARLPDFPFSDATFDAVMFNQVTYIISFTG